MDKLKLEKYDDAIILPYKRDPKGTVGLGGVLDANGNFVETAYCHEGRYNQGGGYNWERNTLKVSEEKVVYYGYFLPHWGHFLIDCLGRMWPFAETGNALDEYKIAFISNQSEFYSNCYEFFHALGVEKSRIIWVDVPTQFKEVVVPEMSYETPRSGRIFHPEYTHMFNRVIENILANTSKEKVEEKYGKIDKVYFTRSLFNNAKSREVGLKVVDNVMLKGGFNILAPEQLSLAEQIAIWNYSKEIACINGTIPLNCIFYRNDARRCGGGQIAKACGFE